MSIKKSLEENKAEILKNLPEEFHDDFLKEMADVKEIPEPLPLKTVEELVASALPEGLKKDAKDISNEITDKPNSAASKEEEKAEILKALPDDLKAGFEKKWNG